MKTGLQEREREEEEEGGGGGGRGVQAREGVRQAVKPADDKAGEILHINSIPCKQASNVVRHKPQEQ